MNSTANQTPETIRANTKATVVAIHNLVPDEPDNAVAVIALALAYCAVGAGFKRHHVDAALDVAFAQADREARRQGYAS